MNDPSLIDQLVRRWQDGQNSQRHSTVPEICQEHPELIAQVEQRIHQLSNPTIESAPDQPQSFEIPAKVGRFQIHDEIARGGMGVVLRGYDQDFDRTLAIKLSQLKRDRDITRRFFEEARISGKLQHPGIPPVHELGELADGRPFFAMKLIAGQTLEQLLRRRSDPGDDQSQLLGVFEHICQTIAYAHNEGVIHRDLKPQNVMVGAFGEVQVMDWGLAKELAPAEASVRDGADAAVKSAAGPNSVGETVRLSEGKHDTAETRFGTVMGTPSYMSPEQARGETDAIDKQTDVFSLGAILCEILTGIPPFGSETMIDTLRKAREGDWTKAGQLLDHCDADPELIAITKRCLATDKTQRMGSAEELASAIQHHLEQVQSRLRNVEIARAAAEAKVAEEVRRRQVERQRNRLWLSLAGALVLVTLLGGAGIIYVQDRRQADSRRAAAEKQLLASGLKEVSKFRQLGRTDEARVALEQVQSLLTSVEDRELNRHQTSESYLLDLLDRLHQMKNQRATIIDGTETSQSVAQKYNELFEDARIYDSESSPETIAARVNQMDIRDELLYGIEIWASVTKDRTQLDRLLAITRAVDPHPVRDRLRSAALWQNPEKLKELVRELDSADYTPSLAMAIAVKIGRQAPDFLRKMARLFPDDHWMARLAGMYMGFAGNHSEALGFFRVALALSPDSSSAWHALAGSLGKTGQPDESMECLRHALKLNPGHWLYLDDMATRLAQRNELEEAIKYHLKSIQAGPRNGQAHANYGNTLSRAGRTDEALRTLLKAAELDPMTADIQRLVGVHYMLKRQQFDKAAEHLRKAVELGSRHELIHFLLGRCLNRVEEYEDATSELQTHLADRPSDAGAHHELAVSFYSTGQFAPAVESIKKAMELYPAEEEDNRLIATRFLAEAEKKAVLVGLLPAIDFGQAVEMSTEERLELGMICYTHMRRFVMAARLFEAAIAEDPSLVQLSTPWRSRAAWAAAMAALGRGNDADNLSEAEKLDWARKALGWLRSDLKDIRQLLDSNVPDRTRRLVRVDLDRLLSADELVGLRDQNSLANWPADDQSAWREFWNDLQETRNSITVEDDPILDAFNL